MPEATGQELEGVVIALPAASLPILRPLCAWKTPPHPGAALVCLGQQLAMALERGDDLRPYLAAHMPVAALLCNGPLTADLEAVHGLRGTAGACD